jgi:hypothetical protein
MGHRPSSPLPDGSEPGLATSRALGQSSGLRRVSSAGPAWLRRTSRTPACSLPGESAREWGDMTARGG